MVRQLVCAGGINYVSLTSFSIFLFLEYGILLLKSELEDAGSLLVFLSWVLSLSTCVSAKVIDSVGLISCRAYCSFQVNNMFSDIRTAKKCFSGWLRRLSSDGVHMHRSIEHWLCKAQFAFEFCTFGICHVPTNV